jgi:hypothetical protein
VIAPKINRITSAVSPERWAMRPARARDGAHDCGVVTRDLDRLTRICLHRVHGVERFVGDRCGIRDAVLVRARQPLLAPAGEDDRQDDERNHEPGVAGKARTRSDQHHGAADCGHDAAQCDRNARADDGLHEFGIGAEARDQLANACALVEGLIERKQMRIKAPAQIGNDALSEQADAEIARGRGEGQHDSDDEQSNERRIQRGRVGVRESAIDHLAHGHRAATMSPGMTMPGTQASRRAARDRE